MQEKLSRSSTDKILYGVCGGIANFFRTPTIAVRLIFIMTASVSFWVYVFLIWSLEERPTY